ncbi:MAG: diguanylate cyclase [Thiomicrorhabdus chilensis]|uniref:transporter substrate-binding domain-containing diguanylate cyclase n=1 Tax=Thiomicrorhabdus chilensis TaxID=63656 RepID=UPI00299CE15A|nr:diguanylate cyclase [Thiomicrorhabdus chilensis]MDX1347749.1 diguanylate cyclase [Thiomicrorhabdus chilensis]
MANSALLKFLMVTLLVLQTALAIAHPVESTEKASTAPHSLENVTLQLKWLHQFQFAGYYAAKMQGYYADEGLDVTIKPRDTFKNNIRQVLDGEAQYGIADSILLLYQARNEPAVIIAPIFQHSPQVFITLESSGINSPYDLQDKDVAFYQKDTDGFSLLAMLEQIDVKPKFNRVKIGSDLDMLARGEVKAYPAYLSNEPFLLQQQGIELNIIRPMNYGIDFYGDMLFTNQTEAIEHPDRVERFRRASIRGWQYALQHKRELAEYIKHTLGSTKSLEHLMFEAEVIERVISPQLIPIGQLDEGRLQYMQNLFVKHGLIDKKFSLQEGIYRPEKLQITYSQKELDWMRDHPVVKVAVDKAWEPIEFVDDKGKFTGIAAGYLNYISQKTGINFQPAQELEWSEAVMQMKSGQLDMYSAVINTQERRDYVNFTQAYLKFPMVIATQRDEAFISDMAQLKYQLVAVVEDYASHENLRKFYPDIPLVLVQTVLEGLEAVSQGKAYAYIDNIAVISHTIKQENFSNLQISGETPFRADITMAVRKDWPELHSILEKTLSGMDENAKNRLTHPWLQVAYKTELEWKTLASILVPMALILLITTLYNRRLSQLNKNLTQTQIQLTESNHKLENLSVTDHLTGVYNRSYIDQTLIKESKRANRNETTLSMILIDLDDFKQVNDIYGHLSGDQVLCQTSNWIQSHIRETDTFGRWGGEEFIIICPDTELDQAVSLGEKLRQGIEEQKFPDGIQLTLSMGVSQYQIDEAINKWISRTDQSLYLAKHQGKNQVVSCRDLMKNSDSSSFPPVDLIQ